MTRKVTTLIERVKWALTPELLKPAYRFMHDPANPTAGHCYHAAEALWHLLGARPAGWFPQVYRESDGITHWWLRHDNGSIADPTADQYTLLGETPPYARGKGCGFLTLQPSRRAAIVMRRVAAF